MKKFAALFFALVFCLLLVGCDKQGRSEAELQSIYQNAENRIFVYGESDSLFKPSVTLLEDNRFQFTFSVVSSYLGIGTYAIHDDLLVLNTDDGMYTYTFKVEMEGDVIKRLIFDEKRSSDHIHFGEFEDGAVFESQIELQSNSNDQTE